MMTREDKERYLRIVLHFSAGFLISHGYTGAGTLVEGSVGVLMELGTLLWSIYGMRITAKLQEMSALGKSASSPVKGVILSSTAEGHALAKAVDGPVVVEGSSQAHQIAA